MGRGGLLRPLRPLAVDVSGEALLLDPPLLLSVGGLGLDLHPHRLGRAVAILGLGAGEGYTGEEELVLGVGEVGAAAGPAQRVFEGSAADQPVLQLAGGEPALDRLGEAVLLLLVLQPEEVVDLGEDQVARAQERVRVEVLVGGDAHQPQLGLDRRVGLGEHLFAGEQLAVDVEHLPHPHPRVAHVEPLLDVRQRRVARLSAAEEDLIGRVVDRVALGLAAQRTLAGDLLEDPLGHVGMARGPQVDRREEGLGVAAELLEPRAEGVDLRPGEVGEADPVADVEGRPDRVLDQVGGGRDPEQAERQAAVGRVLGAEVVGRADRGEEVVGGEREGEHRVDLVDEDDDRLVRRVEQLVADEAVPAVDRGQVLVLGPEELGVVEPEPLGDLVGDREVPLVDRRARADPGEVDADAAKAPPLELFRRPQAEARLADLARREDVAKLALSEGVDDLGVGLALDVEAANRDCAADLEEVRPRAHSRRRS